MSAQLWQLALESIPAGPWAVGVSGGADSVALLSLLRQRSDLSLHVVHLDHQARGAESTGDAQFVTDLCRRFNLPFTMAQRSQIEPTLADLPRNSSARYRAVRMELFRRTVAANRLSGVILAHHADDQAETILLRLLRGSSAAGLTGMAHRSTLGDLIILRPLLDMRRVELRAYLQDINQLWREDSSNSSPRYRRNQVRKALLNPPELGESLIDVARSMSELRRWQRQSAPELADEFHRSELAALPRILAEESARRWLAGRGVPPNQIDASTLQRLINLCTDASQPPRQHFPGRVLVRRRAGLISGSS